MVYRYLETFRAFLPLLNKQVSSRFLFKNFSTKLWKMEAVRTLKDLGYAFNNDGVLRKLDEKGDITDQPFQFNVSDNHQECQARYEELGNAITPYIYHLLENEENLVKLPVPKEGNGTFVFVSEGYDKKDTLLVLIHGSGVVRAGQWARSLIINEKLDLGTQIPYIRKAKTRDYGILVMNTNDNCTPDGKEIAHSGSPEEHALYVWETYITPSKASSVLIVAHSYGGVVTLTLSSKLQEFNNRVKAVAFTDSVHGFSNSKISKRLKEITKNWVSSPKPLDTPLNTPEHDVPRVSAGERPPTLTMEQSDPAPGPHAIEKPQHEAKGHPKHEMTSYSAIESVFNFFNEKLKK